MIYIIILFSNFLLFTILFDSKQNLNKYSKDSDVQVGFNALNKKKTEI